MLQTTNLPLGARSYPGPGSPGRFFRRQFVLHEGRFDLMAGWSRIELRGWKLDHDPEIGITTLLDKKSRIIGLLLGYAVDEHGQFVSGLHKLDLDIDAKHFGEDMRWSPIPGQVCGAAKLAC